MIVQTRLKSCRVSHVDSLPSIFVAPVRKVSSLFWDLEWKDWTILFARLFYERFPTYKSRPGLLLGLAPSFAPLPPLLSSWTSLNSTRD